MMIADSIGILSAAHQYGLVSRKVKL